MITISDILVKVKIVSKFKATHKIKILKSRVYVGLIKKRKRPSNRLLPFGSNIKILTKTKNFISFEKTNG